MEGSNQLTPQTISHPAKKVNRRSHLRRRTRARCECQSIGSKFRSSVSSNKFSFTVLMAVQTGKKSAISKPKCAPAGVQTIWHLRQKVKIGRASCRERV